MAPQPQGSMRVEVHLNNVVICAPTQVEQNVLAIRGEFLIRLIMAPAKSVLEVKEEMRRRGVELEMGQECKEADDANTLMNVLVELLKFEVCICKTQDLSRNEDFRLVKKREIVLPWNVRLVLKKSLALGKDLKNFIDRTTIELKLSKNAVKISFRDI